ncbi:MAG TPA: restriction endonuclease, partial [Thermoanaerobaculia bacterium]|nr:restriction endonuclease [Thermoanaerobaculia bacterium]
MDDAAYHFTPDLLNLLVQTIPRLCRSKNDVLMFFRSAGVAKRHVGDLAAIVQRDKDSITKFELARRVLERINAEGDNALAARREVIKRVVEFEDFSSCWPNDLLEAQGLVAQIRRVVNVKDSFTRMNIEREKEREQRQKTHQAKMARIQKRNDERAAIRKDFFALFAETNPQKRGKALEGILNRLFKVEEILIREAFTLRGNAGEGVVEQIDGVVEIDGHVYLVEMKWWNEPLGVGDVSSHIVRLYGRGDARGIFISSSGYTEPAVSTCKDALHQKVVVLC